MSRNLPIFAADENLEFIPTKMTAATGLTINDDVVYLHNFNARVALIKENDFSQNWLPAITAGVHYKYNDNIEAVDSDLNGTMTSIGIEDNDGVDYTLYASKMLSFLPKPVLVNIGVRNSNAAHTGLLGFTDDREFLAEGNVVVFLSDNFALGAEYRQKPDNYQEINGLIGGEDDWWSMVAAYVVNDSLTISGGYFNLGDVLDEEDTNAFALKMKWEF